VTAVVRPVRPDDFAAWLPLWSQYQAFYEADVDRLTTVETWGRFMEAREPMHAIVADLQGRVVGFAHFVEHRSCWSRHRAMYLEDLFVAPDVRGHGIGRALVMHTYAVARDRGCDRVHWLTHQSNTTAMRLYDQIADRSGFVQYARLLETGDRSSLGLI
jgi:GNAT superfamily N-acetyltransferase